MFHISCNWMKYKRLKENDNLTGNFIKINNVLCFKKKGFTKIVAPLTLRHKSHNITHEKFGHTDIQKAINLLTPIY